MKSYKKRVRLKSNWTQGKEIKVKQKLQLQFWILYQIKNKTWLYQTFILKAGQILIMIEAIELRKYAQGNQGFP